MTGDRKRYSLYIIPPPSEISRSRTLLPDRDWTLKRNIIALRISLDSSGSSENRFRSVLTDHAVLLDRAPSNTVFGAGKGLPTGKPGLGVLRAHGTGANARPKDLFNFSVVIPTCIVRVELSVEASFGPAEALIQISTGSST